MVAVYRALPAGVIERSGWEPLWFAGGGGFSLLWICTLIPLYPALLTLVAFGLTLYGSVIILDNMRLYDREMREIEDAARAEGNTIHWGYPAGVR